MTLVCYNPIEDRIEEWDVGGRLCMMRYWRFDSDRFEIHYFDFSPIEAGRIVLGEL